MSAKVLRQKCFFDSFRWNTNTSYGRYCIYVHPVKEKSTSMFLEEFKTWSSSSSIWSSSLVNENHAGNCSPFGFLTFLPKKQIFSFILCTDISGNQWAYTWPSPGTGPFAGYEQFTGSPHVSTNGTINRWTFLTISLFKHTQIIRFPSLCNFVLSTIMDVSEVIFKTFLLLEWKMAEILEAAGSLSKLKQPACWLWHNKTNLYFTFIHWYKSHMNEDKFVCHWNVVPTMTNGIVTGKGTFL